MSDAELPKARHLAQLAWRKCKRAIEALAYGAFDTLVLATLSPRRNEACAAVVHLELLGDMALWLPYGQALMCHLRQQGKKPILILDSRFLPLASRAFPNIQLIGLPKRAFLRSPRDRARHLRRLRRLGCGLTYHPSSPRDAISMDAVVHALGAPAIGFDAVFADRPAFDRFLGNRLYETLVPAVDNVHQNLSHRAFLQAIGVDLRDIRPAQLPVSPHPPIEGPYWVLAPGASRTFRAWPPQRFAAVARHLQELQPTWRCVLVGMNGERPLTDEIAQALSGQVVNLAGQTDITGLLDLIAHACLVLGNDSAAGHIAAALGTPSVVVVGGGHWGRCYPYDPGEAPVRRLPQTVGVPMPCFGCDWICRYTARTDKPFPCIDAVPIEDVTLAVDQTLSADTKPC